LSPSSDFLAMKRKESYDLWIIIGIAFSMILFLLAVGFGHSIRTLLAEYTNFPFIDLVMYSLTIWIFGLMWIAYRRWHEVMQREERLADIFFSINPVVLLVVNAEGKIITSNPAVRTVLEYEPQELIGKDVTSVIPGLSIRPPHAQAIQAIEQEGYYVYETEAKKKNGEVTPLEVVTCDLKGRRGTVSLIKDISARVEAEKALRLTKEEAEVAHAEKSELLNKLQENYNELKDLEKLRDELIHMVVHDMKSPLQIIMSSLELLTLVPEKRLKFDNEKVFRHALTFSDRLLDMVNSLLDVSRMEAGSMTLQCKECDIIEITNQALESIAPLLKGQDVHVDFGAEKIMVSCDPDIIHRILINLLSNAIKYTHRGDAVSISVCEEDEGVRVTVEDSGPGIAPEYHDVIFEKFGQVKTAHDQHRFVSTGLGLTFCKMAIEEHHGKIGVDSQMDKGSRFWFTLPGG